MSDLGYVVFEGNGGVAPGFPRKNIIGTLHTTPAGLQFKPWQYITRYLGAITMAIGLTPSADDAFVIPWSAIQKCAYNESWRTVFVTFHDVRHGVVASVEFCPYSRALGFRTGTKGALSNLAAEIWHGYSQFGDTMAKGTRIYSRDE